MLVGSHGETVNVEWLKGAAIAGILILIAALAVAGYFYFLYRTEVQENSGAHRLTSAVQKRAAPPKVPANVSSPRPAAPEPSVRRTPVVTQESPAAATAAESPADKTAAEAEKSEVSEAADAEKSAAGDEAQVPEETASPVRSEKPAPVSAEDFEIFYNKSRRILEVKFALKNIDSNESRASGQVFVVLKSDRLNPNRWLSLPETQLISGKPSGKEPGEAFSISRFKTVRIEAKGQPAPNRFDTATVFIFSETGELLLEKDFLVNTD